MRKSLLVALVIVVLLFLGVFFLYLFYPINNLSDLTEEKSPNANQNTSNSSEPKTNDQNENIPLSDWKNRITKKPFGIFITPENSPIQPENFKGYHTGVDFEISDDEIDKMVSVRAICDGNTVEEKYVSGYGGVIIESCKISGEDVLVLYGHIKIDSTPKSTITKGEEIADLADDKSYYSGYERKHLHLGIIKGKLIDYRGYVESKNQLSGWINFENLIQ